MPTGLPSFDLVVATVGRVSELARFLDSLGGQTHRAFRVILVDQNTDDRVSELLAGRGFDTLRVTSAPGLSRARNVGLARVEGDVVAFPDDDCVYPADLLERVASKLAADPGLDGLTGRAVGPDGGSSSSWKRDAAVLTDDNLWNRAISFTIFLRREVVARVGGFDEELGLGSGKPWASGEEIDYLIRAVRMGARIEYDPELTVTHEESSLDADRLRSLGFRDGASIGYILRKYEYRSRVRARMLVRPIGGAVLALARFDLPRARFQAAVLRGRIAGLRGD